MRKFLRYLKSNRGKIVGGIFGFFLALFLIIVWPFILMISLVFLGIFFGALFDSLSRFLRGEDDSSFSERWRRKK
ncbi:DUF2273 domain-containing protein [Candidatus Aerophobetes bacterium]|nr:DUF2273 domain-containing protein [Candidatus Aerophobetes bacterium]